MALYNYKCTFCKKSCQRLLSPELAKSVQLCKECKCPMKRVATAPSMQHMEKLDSGAQVRAVERLVDAEEIFRERSKINPKKDP